MNPTTPAVMTDSVFALTLALLLLAPLAIAGVALINTGLGRSRSAAQSLLGCLAIVATSAIAFALVGSALAGSLPGGPGHSFHMAGKAWNWLGEGPLLLGGLGAAPAKSQLALIFEFLAVCAGGPAAVGVGGGPFPPCRRMHDGRGAGGVRVSAGGLLELGRRMARAVGRELWIGRGLHRRGRRGYGASARRLQRDGRDLDRGTSARQVSQGRFFDRHARTQCRVCAVWLPYQPGGMDGV
jgi:hypothetical protein